MRILRHELDVTEYQTIKLQRSAEVLSVAPSRRDPETTIDVWVLDQEDKWPPIGRGFYVVGTGNSMPEQLRTNDEWIIGGRSPSKDCWRSFAGTVVTPREMVWHVFQGPVQ